MATKDEIYKLDHQILTTNATVEIAIYKMELQNSLQKNE